MNPSQVRANQAQGFAAGTWGGEFNPEFGPRDGDVVVLFIQKGKDPRLLPLALRAKEDGD